MSALPNRIGIRAASQGGFTSLQLPGVLAVPRSFRQWEFFPGGWRVDVRDEPDGPAVYSLTDGTYFYDRGEDGTGTAPLPPNGGGASYTVNGTQIDWGNPAGSGSHRINYPDLVLGAFPSAFSGFTLEMWWQGQSSHSPLGATGYSSGLRVYGQSGYLSLAVGSGHAESSAGRLTMRFEGAAPGGLSAASSSVPPFENQQANDNAWHHYAACLYKQAGELRLFFDGVNQWTSDLPSGFIDALGGELNTMRAMSASHALFDSSSFSQQQTRFTHSALYLDDFTPPPLITPPQF
jgi:hypothetical protein